jgi:hypothetical protein
MLASLLIKWEVEYFFGYTCVYKCDDIWKWILESKGMGYKFNLK